MSNAAFSVFPQTPDPGVPTLRGAFPRYAETLHNLATIGDLSRDRLANVLRNLTRFIEAWHVAFGDGRHVLVPLAEPHRKVFALKFSAETEEEAIAQAAKIAGQLKVGPALSMPSSGAATVRKNGERPLAEFTNDDLVRWIVANPQWKSGYTRRDGIMHIVEYAAWYEDEFNVRSPFKRKKLPTFETDPRREATEGEYVAFMRHANRQLRRALWALWNVAGLRTCEMREMLWSEFNWEGGFWLKLKHKTSRKTKKPRLAVFTRRQLRFFKNLFRQRPPWPDNVFLNTDGKPWTRRSFALALRRTARRIGLDKDVADRVTAYCFRHSFGTQADEAGALQQDTAMLMGHNNPNMLREVYSKASRKVRHVRNAAEQMELLRRRARRQRAAEDKAKRRGQGNFDF